MVETETNGEVGQRIYTRRDIIPGEETRDPTKHTKPLVPRGEVAASIMDIFIIGAASRAETSWDPGEVDDDDDDEEDNSNVNVVPSSPGPTWTQLVPPAVPVRLSLRHKYWWKRCVYTRTTSPSAVKKPGDLSGRDLPTTAISERIVHQVPASSDRESVSARPKWSSRRVFVQDWPSLDEPHCESSFSFSSALKHLFHTLHTRHGFHNPRVSSLLWYTPGHICCEE